MRVLFLRLKARLIRVRWAFALVRSAAPKLFVGLGVNAAIMTIFPAGIALAIRGIINSAAELLSGIPATDTAVYFWLFVGFFITMGGSAGVAVNRYFVQRLETEVRQRLQSDILDHHLKMPISKIKFTEISSTGLRHHQKSI